MWRRQLVVYTVLVKCLLVCGQTSPGFNLARILQARNNRLQQMMMDSLRGQGSSFSTMTGTGSLSPMATSDVTGTGSISTVPGSTGASSFMPIDQLLQQQRNMQSQLLQNVLNFQRSMQTSPVTQSQVDNALSSQMTGGQVQTGSSNVVVGGTGGNVAGVSSTGAGRSTASQTPGTGLSNMFTPTMTGNNTFGRTMSGFGFPTTAGSFWSQGFQATGNPQTGSSGMPSSTATFSPTQGPPAGTQGTPGSTFVPSSTFTDTSGRNFVQSSTDPRMSGQTFTQTSGFTPTSGSPGTSQQPSIVQSSTFTDTSGRNFVQSSTDPRTSGQTFTQTSGFTPTSGTPGTSQQTSFVPSSTFTDMSGRTFMQSSTDPRMSVQTFAQTSGFTPTSGSPGTFQQTFGQFPSSQGSPFSTDLSSTLMSVFNTGRVPGTSSTFFPGTGTGTGTGSGLGVSTTGGDFTSTVNTQPPTQPTAPPSQPALQCTEKYQKMPGHTLCLTDSSLVTNGGVTARDQQVILQMHNQLRAGVQPPAMDLVKLQWDDRLAAVADKWARQCTLAHDNERRIPEMGMTIGQNVAVGYEDWPQAIQQWYNEVQIYRYGLDPDSYLGLDGWRQIAHFTQIVQNGTYLVGCGFAVCPTTEYIRFFVCNYASGQSDLGTPYTAGSQCGMCPNNCVNGLCECGDLYCINKGRLDPGTCTCECPKPYKGRRCEVLDCPAADNWICGRDWPASFCDRFYNVPEECPIMCGLCPGSATVKPEIPTVPNVTFTSAYGCRYKGIRDNIETCKVYGNNGADMKMCATEGGSVGCGECDRYFNIKKDYCPVMCGLCDPPCGGKQCFNGGTLDTNTCQCQCRRPFTGEICDYAQCPVSGDPAFCRFWPVRYCGQYFNVPEECPYMCGICKMDLISPRQGAAGTGTESARNNEPMEAS